MEQSLSDLERKIAVLEKEIDGYVAELSTTTSNEEKSKIRILITTSRETLNLLLRQYERKALSEGKFDIGFLKIWF